MFSKLQKHIYNNINLEIKKNNLSNQDNFAKDIEPILTELVTSYLEKNKFNYSFKVAKNKNEFPDLKLKVDDITYAVEYKTALHSNNASDMGTLKSYPEKIKEYEDNIYCIFVKYEYKKKSFIIHDIYIDKIYKFIGKTKVKGNSIILKYRKKDGNLRPKSWNDFKDNKCYIKNLNGFKKSIEDTNQYRSISVIKEHIDILDSSGRKKIVNYINSLK